MPMRLFPSMAAAPAATSCGDCVGTTRCRSSFSRSYQPLALSGSRAAVSPDCVAQISWRLALGEQNVLAVEIREGKPVARQIRSRHDAIGRKLATERR